MVVRILFFLAGILLAQQLPALPEPIWLVASAVIAGVLAWLRYWRGLFFLSGVLWAIAFASVSLADQLPEPLAGQDVQVQGYIADFPEHESNHVRFNLKVVKTAHNVPENLRLTWYYPDQTIKAGQHWSFTVRLKRPHGNFNPSGFDYERWLFVEGIGATGYIRAKPQPKLLDNGSTQTSLLVWRQHIAEQLEQLLANSSSLALIKALTIGDDDSLSANQ